MTPTKFLGEVNNKNIIVKIKFLMGIFCSEIIASDLYGFGKTGNAMDFSRKYIIRFERGIHI